MMEPSFDSVEIQKNLLSYRRAILIYEADGVHFNQIFTHFLFNSWLYALRIQHEYRNKYDLDKIFATNIIDITAFIPLSYHHKLPTQCQYISNMTNTELSYIYSKTRRESLCLIFYNNNSFHQDPEYVNILSIKYKFLNSIDCVISFEENYPDLYYSYDYILKTDDDTFLTPFFLYQFPSNTSEFITGHGGYAWHNRSRLQLLNISNILNLKHCAEPKKYCFNIGCTWYGAPHLIFNVAKLTIKTNIYLLWLFDTKQTSYNKWVEGWYREVTSLYASDIAINHLIIHNDSLVFKTHKYNQDYLLMDVESQRGGYINLNNKIIHIHVWQRGGWFGKTAWKNRMREHLGDVIELLNVRQYDRMSIRLYCTSLAFDLHLNLSVNLFDIDQLLLDKGYIHVSNRTITKKKYVEPDSVCTVTGDHVGGDILIQEPNLYLILTNVDTWQLCKLYCQQNVNNTYGNYKKCNGWTWHEPSSTCYPKMTFHIVGVDRSRSRFVSGPVNCDNRTHLV